MSLHESAATGARIPFVRPTMPAAHEVGQMFQEIGQANWYTNFGPMEQRFRAGITGYLGRDIGVATVANATVGLIAALAALLPRGDGSAGIAVASFTFAAGPQAIMWHGYRPEWIDVDPVSLQPSVDSCERALAAGASVRAVLLTNTFGIGGADLDAWEALCAREGIPLIIDSAAGFGSRYPDGELLGHRGDCEVFSFHATKPFGIGEGGAIVSHRPEVIERVTSFANFGFADREVGAAAPGMNTKMSELMAAIGCRLLETFDAHLADRRAALAAYGERLTDPRLAVVPSTERSSVGFVPLLVETRELRDEILSALHADRIDAKTYYSPAVHRQPFFHDFAPGRELGTTESVSGRMLSLPVLGSMSAAEVARVCTAIEARL